MNDDETKKILVGYLQQGLTLNEIHKVLADEHAHKITFMELRLLSAEIEDMDWSQFDPKVEAPVEEDASSDETPLAQGTVIEVSKVHNPKFMYSGSVTFISGIKGSWYVDQMGQLGMDLDDDTQQPTEEDMQDFQMSLQQQLTGG